MGMQPKQSALSGSDFGEETGTVAAPRNVPVSRCLLARALTGLSSWATS
jgi:hypothetical protein